MISLTTYLQSIIGILILYVLTMDTCRNENESMITTTEGLEHDLRHKIRGHQY